MKKFTLPRWTKPAPSPKPAKDTKPGDATGQEEVRYLNLGSPNHPDNPIHGVPAKPFTFTLVDTDGAELNEAWCKQKLMRHASAGIFSADALDKIIASAAANQAASIRQQLMGEGGHVHLITQLKSKEPDYFNKLRNSMEDQLNRLEKVVALIKLQNS